MFFQKRPAAGVEWIICALGNPGREYDNSRHNVGFTVAEELSRRHGIDLRRLRFKAVTGTGEIGGRKVLLMKPNTYMNLSGTALQEAAAFYKVPAQRCLVISDDVSLDPGQLRLRRKGSAGGHNGLKSIINMLGTQDFPRVKIGVGQKPHPDYDLADWVLGKFPPEQRPVMAEAAERAAGAVECILHDGMDQAMSKYN